MKRILLALVLLAALCAPALANRVKMPVPLPPNQVLLSCDALTTCQALLVPGPTRQKYELAGIVSRPFNYVAGQLILSNSLNQNENTLYTLVNGQLDSQNINTAVGIGPNQLNTVCTGCTATFGGTVLYIFPASLTINANADGNVPAKINGNSAAQSADLLDVFLSAGGTKLASIDNLGTILYGGVNGPASMQVTAAFTNFLPAGSTKPFNWSNAANTFNNMQLADTGDLEVAPLINAVRTLSRVPPVYTAAGAVVASTAHSVRDTASCTTTAGGQCTASVVFTNNAIFAANNTFACGVNDNNAGILSTETMAVQSGGTGAGFNILINGGGNTVLHNFSYVCTGT